MSVDLRDYFAGLAMQSAINEYDIETVEGHARIVSTAYGLADAMLAERAKSAPTETAEHPMFDMFYVTDKDGEDPYAVIGESNAMALASEYDSECRSIGPHRIFRIGKEIKR